jgi:membrane associated rhomboid family serine protease
MYGTSPNFPSQTVGAYMGLYILIFFIFIIGSNILWLWVTGTLLKAALGISKWNVLLLLIPIVGIIMFIIWGFQAHNLLKERQAPSSGKSQAYYSDRR